MLRDLRARWRPWLVRFWWFASGPLWAGVLLMVGSHGVLIAIVIVVLLLGFGGWSYAGPSNAGQPAGYPYRSYAIPGVGLVVIIVVVLFLAGVL